MKKIVIWLGLLGMVSAMSTTQVRADEISEDSSIDVTSQVAESDDGDLLEATSKAKFKIIQFKSKPPKKYKGLSLIQVKKNKNGYLGYYV